MADQFEGYSKGLESPADRHYSVTPNDSSILDPLPRALFVSGAGDVAIQDSEGVSVTYTVTAGAIIPFRAHLVLSTGTTATGIVAWY